MPNPELEKLRAEALSAIEKSQTTQALQEASAAALGRNGTLTAFLKNVRDLPAEQRKDAGRLANQIKGEITAAVDNAKERIQDAEAKEKASFDPTLPGLVPSEGGLHPITQMIYDLNDAFSSLGFEVYEGPEITSERYAFDSLNFPPDHPARESMDTYWLEGTEDLHGAERLCLRPHLTGASIRYMREHVAPMRFVYPGHVFRNEATDASHERAFVQYEALMIDRSVPFPAGKLMVETILSRVFGRSVETRMRAGFFPFVEPGFEIDMQCLVCGGAGCRVCKGVGWLEVMPGGPPHPNVMRAGGLDPAEWDGFYINIGLDRLVMMRYGVDDVRLLHSMDLRVLSQFK